MSDESEGLMGSIHVRRPDRIGGLIGGKYSLFIQLISLILTYISLLFS